MEGPFNRENNHCRACRPTGSKVGISSGKQPPGGAAQQKCNQRRGHCQPNLPQPDPMAPMVYIPAPIVPMRRKKLPKGNIRSPGQRIQKAKTPGISLSQHTAPGQHKPDGKQVPHQHLPIAQGVLVAPQRHHRRQNQPAAGPQGCFPGCGTVQRPGHAFHTGHKHNGKQQQPESFEQIDQQQLFYIQPTPADSWPPRPTDRVQQHCRGNFGRTFVEGTPGALFGNFVMRNSCSVVRPTQRHGSSGIYPEDRRAAVQRLAQSLQGGKPHRLGLVIFQEH